MAVSKFPSKSSSTTRAEPYWDSLYQVPSSTTFSRPSRQEIEEWDKQPFQETSLPADLDGAAVTNGHHPSPGLLVQQWDRAEKAYNNDEVLELQVVGFNQGGLLVDCFGLQGFVPASQIRDIPHFHIETERIRELKRRQDQVLSLQIIEFDRNSRRMILSERIAGVTANDRHRLVAAMQSGQIRPGRITNLTKFGAFVDLGGLEGLIHISELSWGRVEHPSQVVRAGDDVEVLVLNVDREKERVALSLKRLQPNPWETVAERFQPGLLVDGVVSNIVHFGVFVQIDDGLEGLIHLSELTDSEVTHPRHVVSLGQKVRPRILEVNGPKRRLALSLRQLPEASE